MDISPAPSASASIRAYLHLAKPGRDQAGCGTARLSLRHDSGAAGRRGCRGLGTEAEPRSALMLSSTLLRVRELPAAASTPESSFSSDGSRPGRPPRRAAPRRAGRWTRALHSALGRSATCSGIYRVPSVITGVIRGQAHRLDGPCRSTAGPAGVDVDRHAVARCCGRLQTALFALLVLRWAVALNVDDER